MDNDYISGGLAAEIGKKLESMIVSGELKIGQQLPTERELADALSVSKGVVHAGITDIARKGFLRIVPRHGVYVADYVKNGTLEVLSAIVNNNGGKIDKALAESIMKTRLALEGISVYELAQNHTDMQLTRLRAMLGNMRSAVEKGEIKTSRELSEKIQEMFMAKCVMSGNHIIPIFVSSSSELSIKLTQYWVESVGFDETIRGQERTLERIAAGDAAGALANLKQEVDAAIAALYE